MNLGNVLKQAGGTPLTGREVQFEFISEDKEKNRQQIHITASLFPVSEHQRILIRQQAKEYCTECDEAGKLLHPEADYQDELTYRFLITALRDSEDCRQPWAVFEQLPLVRKGLIQQQCIWLAREYDLYLADQYPELRAEQTGDAGANLLDAQRVKGEAKVTFQDGQG